MMSNVVNDTALAALVDTAEEMIMGGLKNRLQMLGKAAQNMD